MVTVPNNFNGAKFANKYNLKWDGFWIDRTGLHCPMLPNLTELDLSDCVCDTLIKPVSVEEKISLLESRVSSIEQKVIKP